MTRRARTLALARVTKASPRLDFEEALELDVIDDEALTEAVLRRVVERLLKRQ